MAGMRFETCCGCIELKTGCLIIGYLNLIGTIIMVALSCLGIAGAGILASQPHDGNEKDKDVVVMVTTAALVLTIILLLISLTFLTFTIVFLVGIHKNKKGHVKAYMVYAVIYLIISAIMFFASFANSPINASDVCFKLATILLNIYFLLVIRSYYFKMDDTNRQPAIYNTA